MHVQDPEPRVFTVRDRNGIGKVERVYLANVIKNQMGEAADSVTGDWTSRRIYREDLARASAEKRFLPYRPKPGQENAEHERALSDVRGLIRLHGAGGGLQDLEEAMTEAGELLREAVQDAHASWRCRCSSGA